MQASMLETLTADTTVAAPSWYMQRWVTVEGAECANAPDIVRVRTRTLGLHRGVAQEIEPERVVASSMVQRLQTAQRLVLVVVSSRAIDLIGSLMNGLLGGFVSVNSCLPPNVMVAALALRAGNRLDVATVSPCEQCRLMTVACSHCDERDGDERLKRPTAPAVYPILLKGPTAGSRL